MHRPSAKASSHPPRLAQHVAYIKHLVDQGGPDPSEYEAFRAWLGELARQHRTGKLSEEDLDYLRSFFGDALSPKTLQGFSFKKPHGYTGDHEIIDRVYQEHVTSVEHLKNWDRYFQTRGAPTAVRNRKEYFLNLLRSMEATYPERESLPVLNIASGPARDVFEFFHTNGHNDSVAFQCIDNDPDAIDYAQELCNPYLNRVQFIEKNALRYHPDDQFQLAWSAGLFDYLSDKAFKFLLEHMLDALRDDGELVVGNFSPENPTLDYMEVILDWDLHYRDEDHLIELAKSCGIDEEDIRVGSEPEGINLFLHVKRGEHFLPMDCP